MKQKRWKRFGAALLAAAMSLLQMPSGLTIAEDDAPEIYVRQDTVSEDGASAVHWINADGEEIPGITVVAKPDKFAVEGGKKRG